MSLGPENISGYMAGTVPAVGYSPNDLNVLYAASGRGGPWDGNIYMGQSVSGFGGVSGPLTLEERGFLSTTV